MPKMTSMFVSLLVLLLGTAARAAPVGDEDLTEGDMILNAVQKEMFSKALIKNAEDQEKADNYKEGEEDSFEGEIETGKSMIGIDQFKWPENTLYYDLSEISWWSAHWHGMKDKIRKALDKLQRETGDCVKFIEKESGPRVEVHTHSDDGCQSQVGYQSAHEPKAQELNLSPGGGCDKEGKIQHEFLHALGFFHTQSRSDRDKYITVKMGNIQPKAKNNFEKLQPWLIKHFGLPFDYKSIMMYPGNAFSRSPRGYQLTIVTKDPSKQNLIGNRAYLSDGDIQMIKKAYGCA